MEKVKRKINANIHQFFDFMEQKEIVSCDLDLNIKSPIIIDGQELSILEVGQNILIAQNLEGKRFEVAKKHLSNKKKREDSLPYYLLHGTPVKIEKRVGKFMVHVCSDRFSGTKKVFTSDLQTDLSSLS